MTKRRKDLVEKTLEMIEAGVIKTEDFSDINAWKKSSPESRKLSLEEEARLRKIVKKRVAAHRNKPT
jgi:hypothetical protein